MDSRFSSTDRFIIDRFEEHNAVLENAATREIVSLPKAHLPADASPGDTLILQNGTWSFDHQETAARKTRIDALFAKIKEKNL